MLLLFRWGVIAFVIGAAQSGYAQGSCKALEPMRTLVLKKMYSDAKFSIINEANEADNAKTRAPLVAFLQAMEHALDGPNGHPGNPESDCAFENFGHWAHAGALTFEPPVYEGQGTVGRGLLCFLAARVRFPLVASRVLRMSSCSTDTSVEPTRTTK